MRRPIAVAVLAAAVLAAGCGGSDGGETGGGTGTGGAYGSGEAGGTPARELFAGACGSCHTLADADTSGSFGPSLDELQPDRARVLEAIRSGPGGMPANLLEGERAQAVADYVAAAAG